MVAVLFAILFSLSILWVALAGAIETISRETLREVRNVLFYTGLVTLFVWLAMSYNWLGEKPDYSRTAYTVKVQGWGPVIYPRAKPGPKPSEPERIERRAGIMVDLIGLSVIVAGILLMLLSSAFNYLI